MPKRQLNMEELTPFARLLWDWMLDQRPTPLRTPAELAERTGIHRQTVWQWLTKGTMPHPDSLPPLSLATGIPLEKLYEAAGLGPAKDGQTPDAWQKLINAVQRSQQLPLEARRELIEEIKQKRAQYAIERAEIEFTEKRQSTTTQQDAPAPPSRPENMQACAPVY